MAERKKPEPVASESSAPEPAADNGTAEYVEFGSWEFVDRIPTREEVKVLLETLPPRWGIEIVDYLEYVTPLPQGKKTKVRRGNVTIDQTVQVCVLYVSVAGRMAMLRDAEEKHGWQVDFEPEPVTPTGVPGWLQNDDRRLVYREYLVIHEQAVVVDENGPAYKGWSRKGRKPGTAWVPQTGGANAKGSNPIEKVETAARGRALAAWGFGVLPGSGVASLEEIQQVAENMIAQQQRHGEHQNERANFDKRLDPKELQQKALQLLEDLRVLRNQSEYEADQKTIGYCWGRFKIDVAVPDADPELPPSVDLSRLTPGAVQIMCGAIHNSIVEEQTKRKQI